MLERWAVRAGVVVLVAGTLVHGLYGYSHEDLSGHAVGSDDAYISYRYARNLAAGHGLTFNPGARVEGYSNLLFVLLLAPAFLIARDSAIHPIAVALSIVCAAAALVLFHGRLRDRDGGGPAALAAVLFAAWPALWLWSASGMETALVLLLQVALWAEVTRDDGAPRIRPLVVVLVLLVLSRADGFVGAGIAVLFLALRRDGARARAGALAVALSTAALVGWRLAYYGHPLPNTYYAKVSGPLAARMADAARQLGDLALGAGLLPYIVVLAAAAVAAARARRLAYEPFFAACWIAYWIYVGGDVFGERFLLVLVPLGAAVLARWAAEGRRVPAATASSSRSPSSFFPSRPTGGSATRARNTTAGSSSAASSAGPSIAARPSPSTPRARSPTTRASPPSTCSASPTRTSATGRRRHSASATTSTTRNTCSRAAPT